MGMELNVNEGHMFSAPGLNKLHHFQHTMPLTQWHMSVIKQQMCRTSGDSLEWKRLQFGSPVINLTLPLHALSIFLVPVVLTAQSP